MSRVASSRRVLHANLEHAILEFLLLLDLVIVLPLEVALGIDASAGTATLMLYSDCHLADLLSS
jgi:hypothetical protein